MDPSSVAIALHSFAANDLYDPNVTGGGHQPLGFDQLMALYNHFHVISSKIRVDFCTQSGSSPVAGGCVCMIHVNDDVTLGDTDARTMLEMPGTNWSIMQPVTKSPLSLRHSYDATSWNPGDIMANDNLQGSSSSSPTEKQHFTLGVASIDQSTDPVVVHCWVEIEYTAVFHEPKDLAQS